MYHVEFRIDYSHPLKPDETNIKESV
jgi:hypothetical protein